jgi:hypothetical protein
MAAVQDSKFCLNVYGHGYGVRLVQYVMAGCVPVTIQVNYAHGL